MTNIEIKQSIHQPIRLDWDDHERDEHIADFWKKTPQQRLNQIQETLISNQVSIKAVRDLSNAAEVKPLLPAAFGINPANESDIETCLENLSDPDLETLLTLLVPDTRIEVERSPFAEIFSIKEAVSVYTEIWERAFAELNLAAGSVEIDVQIDGEALSSNTLAYFDSITLSFTVNERDYRFEYERHEVYEDELDFAILEHLEQVFHEQGLDRAVLNIPGNFGNTLFLLPGKVVESFDRLVDYMS